MIWPSFGRCNSWVGGILHCYLWNTYIYIYIYICVYSPKDPKHRLHMDAPFCGAGLYQKPICSHQGHLGSLIYHYSHTQPSAGQIVLPKQARPLDTPKTTYKIFFKSWVDENFYSYCYDMQYRRKLEWMKIFRQTVANCELAITLQQCFRHCFYNTTMRS